MNEQYPCLSLQIIHIVLTLFRAGGLSDPPLLDIFLYLAQKPLYLINPRLSTFPVYLLGLRICKKNRLRYGVRAHQGHVHIQKIEKVYKNNIFIRKMSIQRLQLAFLKNHTNNINMRKKGQEYRIHNHNPWQKEKLFIESYFTNSSMNKQDKNNHLVISYKKLHKQHCYRNY